MDLEFFKNVKLFEKLSERQLNLIAALVIEESIPAETVIIREGEIGKYLYLIKTGEVKVVKQFGDDIFSLTQLGEGDFFGELSLIDDYLTSATVITTEDSEFIKIKADDFLALTRIDSGLSASIWEALARCLSDRIRKTSDIVRNYYGLSKALCENEEFRMLFTSWNFGEKKSK